MRLFVYADSNTGGTFRWLHRLNQTGQISDIDIVSLKEIVERPYKLISMLKCAKADRIIVCMAPYNPFIYLFALIKKIKGQDSIIYFSSWPYWGENKYRWRPCTPFVRTVWDRFLCDIKGVAVNKKAYTGMIDKGVKAFYIPHSVDTTVFYPRGKGEDGSLRILYVGRMIPQKGVALLLNIAKQLSHLNTEFWFVGKGSLSEMIQQEQQHSKIKYFGHIDNAEKLAEIYSQADIFVLPSYTQGVWEERFGIVLVEAMSCGLPVIATDCIGPREIVEDGKNGFIVPQRDEAALKEKIELLVADKELRQRMGAYGRAVVEEKYDIQAVAQMWWHVLSN